MIVETIRTWKYNTNNFGENCKKLGIAHFVVSIVVLIIITIFLAPVMMVYYEYCKFKGSAKC
jgi:hypothetical protein